MAADAAANHPPESQRLCLWMKVCASARLIARG